MTEHTPTSWETTFTLRLQGANGFIIGGVHSPCGTREIDAANAAHIVRCVNSHDALVAACRVALELPNVIDKILNPDVGAGFGLEAKRKDILQKIRDALALAEPRKES